MKRFYELNRQQQTNAMNKHPYDFDEWMYFTHNNNIIGSIRMSSTNAAIYKRKARISRYRYYFGD